MLAAWLLAGCNGCNSGQRTAPPAGDSSQTVAPDEGDTLRNWTEQRLIKWKSWIDSSLAGNFSPDSLARTTIDTIPTDTVTMEPERFEEFKPYFVYSPDSSQVVDMVSYGNFLHKGRNGKTVLEYGEPDTEVAIVDVQTKKRIRILFFGPSSTVKEAVWLNDHTVLLAGGAYDEKDQLQPMIWKYDTKTRLLENWESPAY